MANLIEVQRSKRRWGLFGAGCSLLVLIPFALLVLIAVVGTAKTKPNDAVGILAALVIFVPMLGLLGHIVIQNVQRASSAKKEMKVISEKMEAQGGSISVSQEDSAGGMTEVLQQQHDLSSADVAFDFESSEVQSTKHQVVEASSVSTDK